MIELKIKLKSKIKYIDLILDNEKQLKEFIELMNSTNSIFKFGPFIFNSNDFSYAVCKEVKNEK